MRISLLATHSVCHQFSCTNSFYLPTFLPDDLFSTRASNQSINWCPDVEDFVHGFVVPSCLTGNSSVEM